MSFSRSSSFIVAALLMLVAAEVHAQSRVGRQWLTSGLSVSPTFVTDSTADDSLVIGGGLRARIGFQHVISAPFVMAAEVELGTQYLPASTVAADGQSDGGAGVGWQAGLIGRWVPRGDVTGPALGFGLHTFRASLPETPVQALSGDLRFGWYFWQKNDFVLAEIGYAIPFLEGVDAPAAFDGTTTSIAEQNWTMHRLTFGFSFSF